MAACATAEHVRRLVGQQIAVVPSSQLRCIEPEGGDQRAVRAVFFKLFDARPQLPFHRRPRDDRMMPPAVPADLGVDRPGEQLAEVHLAFVREAFGQSDPATDVVPHGVHPSRSPPPPGLSPVQPARLQVAAAAPHYHPIGPSSRLSRSETVLRKTAGVPPRGFEPLISTLKGWRPRPLDDGGRAPGESTRGSRPS